MIRTLGERQRRLLIALLCLIPTHGLAEPLKNSPAINYMLHCQGCHLPGGIGHPGVVPKLRGSIGRFLNNEQGRLYLVQVPGVAHSALSNRELADVLNWILEEFDPTGVPQNFEKFDEAEVAAHRYKPQLDVAGLRARALANGKD